ncbi:MAG: class I tRNA ligase family protein [Paracoccaceae bacterium]
MPSVTEELWGQTGERAKMLVHADWPGYGAELIDAEADREMNWVIALIEDIRSARMQMACAGGLKRAAHRDDWPRTNGATNR